MSIPEARRQGVLPLFPRAVSRECLEALMVLHTYPGSFDSADCSAAAGIGSAQHDTEFVGLLRTSTERLVNQPARDR